MWEMEKVERNLVRSDGLNMIPNNDDIRIMPFDEISIDGRVNTRFDRKTNNKIKKKDDKKNDKEAEWKKEKVSFLKIEFIIYNFRNKKN